MHILIHSDEYYPSGAACAYRMKVFADVFSAKGHAVTVIASSANKTNGKIEDCRERIIYSPTVKMKKKTAVMRLLNNISFAVTSLFAGLFVGKVDVVITTSPPPLVSISGWLIAKIKRAKLVYDVRDIWPDVALEMGSFSEDSFFCKVFRGITNFMYRHADMVTTVSPGKVEKIRSKLPEKDNSKVHLVSNGFDESVLTSKEVPGLIEDYGLRDQFTCVYIGNIGLAQGLGMLLDLAAASTRKNVQFLLFGSGAERAELERRVNKEGLNNVRFCGVLEHEKVLTLLSNVQISFVPLKSANMKDSVPTKIYEALGIGCPVFLIAEGDACEIVKETGLGRCLSPDQVAELPNVFEQMIADYSEIICNQEKAKTIMLHKYSRQKITEEFEKLLCKLCSARIKEEEIVNG